jgi:hypothetical protein
MPIRPDLREHYTGPIWRLITNFVRFERAKGCCETCGRRHGQIMCTLPDGRVHFWGEPEWFWSNDEVAPYPNLMDMLEAKFSKVSLATAHLNNDPRDRSDTNLKSLCQRCHLNHDREFHLEQARANRRAKLAIRDLFPEV